MQKIPRNLDELRQGIDAARKALDPDDTRFDRFVGQYTPSGYIPDRLKWPSHFSTERELRNRRRANWSGVDPRIAEFSFRFLLAMQKVQIPFFVHSAYRTRQEQNELVAAKRSKTPWPRAAHCQGKAVDLVHSRYAWELAKPEWDFVGRIGFDVHAAMMKNIKVADRWQLSWGGTWRFYDPAHWEIADWKDNIRIPVDAPSVVFDCSPRVAVRDRVWMRLAS